LLATVGLALCHVNSSPARAEWFLSPEFNQVSRTPDDFQNSTVLSVSVSPGGTTLASGGFSIATVPFDGSSGPLMILPFTSNRFIVENMRFDQEERLNLLMLNYDGPGSVWRPDHGTFASYVEFGPLPHFPSAFAFDTSGALIVGGGYGNLAGSGWIRRYDWAGNLETAFDISEVPQGLAFNSHGSAFMASFNGKLFGISDSALTPPNASRSARPSRPARASAPRRRRTWSCKTSSVGPC
jgi:hypothetical protein